MCLSKPKKSASNDTKIIQYFIMYLLGLCIKLNSFVAHMLYAWSFIYNTSVTTAINKKQYYLYWNAYTTVFAWGAVSSNTNRT